MSFSDWFTGKRAPPKTGVSAELKLGPKQFLSGRDKGAPHMPERLDADNSHNGGSGRLKRHARREQLYVAIREAMTRCGVLSSRYKFKVLSLDQNGNEFLVMMDVAEAIGSQPAQLAAIEAAIIQSARARFEISVPAVYWRTEIGATVVLPKASTPKPARLPAVANGATSSRAVAPPYEPIQADEVAAFKQALLAAAANGRPAPMPDGVQVQSGPRSYTLLTGFEDTEMPETQGAPHLSNTQYGDLV